MLPISPCSPSCCQFPTVSHITINFPSCYQFPIVSHLATNFPSASHLAANFPPASHFATNFPLLPTLLPISHCFPHYHQFPTLLPIPHFATNFPSASYLASNFSLFPILLPISHLATSFSSVSHLAHSFPQQNEFPSSKNQNEFQGKHFLWLHFKEQPGFPNTTHSASLVPGLKVERWIPYVQHFKSASLVPGLIMCHTIVKGKINSLRQTFQVCQSGARTNHASHNCEGKD